MPGVGFYSGYLDALKVVSGVDQRDQQLALEQQNQDRLNQISQVQMQGQLQQQAFDRANFYKQEDAQQVLGTLFQQNATASANADANAQSDITSNLYRKAGAAIMGKDPRTGLMFLREADNMDRVTNESRLSEMKREKVVGDHLSALAAGAVDQASWNNYLTESARFGKSVPAQYSTWGPETQAYAQRMAIMGIPVAKQAELEVRKASNDIKAASQQARDAHWKATEAWRDRVETRRQEGQNARIGLEAERAGRNINTVAQEIQILSDLDQNGGFKTALIGKKQEAVQDVLRRASVLHTKGVPMENAMAQARQSVLGEFAKGIPLIGKGTRETSPTAASAPTEATPQIETMQRGGKTWYKVGPNQWSDSMEDIR